MTSDTIVSSRAPARDSDESFAPEGETDAEKALDEALKESFPASDPIAVTGRPQ